MPEIIQAVRLPGIRINSLGSYLAALGLMKACSQKWPDLRGLWCDDEFVVGAGGLDATKIREFLLGEWRPTKYERWWKGSKDITRLRSWEPSVARIKILDAHIVAKGRSNVYNDILGTGGNVAKRDFSKLSEACTELIRRPSSETWLTYSLFGSAGFRDGAEIQLPDLPSTGTWFANSNKAFNSGFSSAREGQLSPWSYLLALEGALLLSGGSGKRLSARASKYATFPFVSEAASPLTEGEMKKERSEFWAPVWDKPASFTELKALLQRGQARVGNRAARAPIDFAAAALTWQARAGLVRFERFSLRETTSSNTYEAIASGSVSVTSSRQSNSAVVSIANWVESLPSDKSLFAGVKAPVERMLLRVAQSEADGLAWRELLLTVGETQRRVDQNKNWRTSKPISEIPESFFAKAWPGEIGPEAEIARAISSLDPITYGLRHNIFGLSQAKDHRREIFADPRPASAVWHEGDPTRRLADILERRLVDASVPPLKARRYCPAAAVDLFVTGRLDVSAVTDLLPAFSLICWRRTNSVREIAPLPGASVEFLMQGYFRPLLTPVPLRLAKGADPIVPDATRARTLVKMLRGGMWPQAFALAEGVYRSSGIDVVRPPVGISMAGDRITACFLIPVELAVIRKTFRRWMVRTKKGQM